MSGTASARSPLPANRLALIQEASFQSQSTRLRLDITPAPTNDGLGRLMVGIFEHKVSLPLLGTLVLRPGQLPAALDKPQFEKLGQSGRLWEKILNGFERWSSVYQSSIQLVKTLD